MPVEIHKTAHNSKSPVAMRSWGKRFFNWYSSCLVAYPHITNSVTGFIVAGAGDAVCQYYFEDNAHTKGHPPSIDMKRVLEMGLIRATIVTPFTQCWYKVLARISPATTLQSALKRVVVDQIIGSPVVIMLVFLGKAILAGDPQSAVETTKLHLFSTWLVGFQYWPIMHTINFRYVPMMYQPLYATFASLYWNAVLSYYANKKVSTIATVSSLSPISSPSDSILSSTTTQAEKSSSEES